MKMQNRIKNKITLKQENVVDKLKLLLFVNYVGKILDSFKSINDKWK